MGFGEILLASILWLLVLYVFYIHLRGKKLMINSTELGGKQNGKVWILGIVFVMIFYLSISDIVHFNLTEVFYGFLGAIPLFLLILFFKKREKTLSKALFNWEYKSSSIRLMLIAVIVFVIISIGVLVYVNELLVR